MSTAVVVGAGPNGLAAAAVLAKAGVDVTVLEAADEIGGGTRTVEGIVPGLLHDQCSAVHSIASGSPLFEELELQRYGLRWCLPEIDCVHPLEGGPAGVLHRSVRDTAEGLGADGGRWLRMFAGPAAGYDELAVDILGPLLAVPRHPVRLTRFGLPTLLPGALLARAFRTRQARALFAGVAAHTMHPLSRPLTSAIGLGLITAGHRHGWPVAAGGSRAITDAMAAVLAEHGGKVETGTRVTAASQLPRVDVVLFDLAPGAVAEILGERLPSGVGRAYRRFPHGPAAFKVDFAVEGGVPWADESARRAGTVHLGGDLAEVVAGERDIHAGRLPLRPFVLVGQQYLADPSRSVGDIHPVWSYAHVPHDFRGDATDLIISQIERFAPGFRERVVGTAVRSTTEMSRYNPNFVGGDILTGSTTAAKLIFGARPTAHPYDVGIPGMFLCSAATPPGPGAHGMCGRHAAHRALRHLGVRP